MRRRQGAGRRLRVLYAASILWILGYDTIYATRTARTTRWWAISSTARLFGAASRWLVAGCYALMLAALVVTGLVARLGPWFFPALLLPAAMLAWQVMRLDVGDPARCLGLFKSNREVGLAVAAGDPGRAAVTPGQNSSAPTRRLSARHWCRRFLCSLATEITPIWQASEELLSEHNIEPPFWAFAWPGGQATARHILDHPPISPARLCWTSPAAAASPPSPRQWPGRAVQACEIDPLASAAIGLNAALNGVTVEAVTADLVGSDWRLGHHPVRRRLLRGADDAATSCPGCGGRPRAARCGWPTPGRAYLPGDGLTAFARYKVPTTLELEDRTEREVVLYRLLP